MENEEKFRELILYISQQCASDPTFGATKLNKILYFADFLSYAARGESITGLAYQKLPNGPAPKRLLPIREKMIDERILGIQEIVLQSGHVQKRTVNLRPPKTAIFTGDEIAVVDTVIAALKNLKAEGVSELSHRMVGWKVARDNEEIPYGTIFLSDEPLSEVENERGRELATVLGIASA